MSLVTIDKVTDLGLAQLIRMKLEAHGVPVHLHSAGFASLFGTGTSFSAMRIQVPESLAWRARELLKELYEDLDAEEGEGSG